MKAKTKHVGYVVAALLLVALSLLFALSSRQSAKQLGFSFFGIPYLATGGLSFGITNASCLDIDYITCPPQLKSNGVWLEVQPPSPGAMTLLPEGQAGTLVVTAPSHGEVWRVPVLWGYRPTKVQRLKKHTEIILGKLYLLDRGAIDPDFHLVLFTNYSAEITP